MSVWLYGVEGKKNADIICYMLASLVCLHQGNVKRSKKLMDVVTINKENLPIFRMIWGILKRI